MLDSAGELIALSVEMYGVVIYGESRRLSFMCEINCKKLPGLAIVLIAIFSVLWTEGLPITIGQTTATTTTKPDYRSWRKSLDHNPPPQRGCFTITYPSTAWQSIHCVTAPSVPLGPMTPSAVGNGVDEVAYSGSGTLIGSSTGSFQSIAGLTSETDSIDGSNYYSLQINSQFFSTTTSYTGNKAALGWEQFVFINYPAYGEGYIYIQYWLINYQSTYGSCPSTGPPGGSSWMTFSGSCYANSPSGVVPYETATNLGNLILKGYTNFNSNDQNLFCISGGTCYSVSPTDQVLDLYQHWLYSEFNVFGFGNGSMANFNSGTSITVVNALEDQSGNVIVPSCVNTGYTGETNNLNLGSCSSNGSNGEILFSETNGQPISPQASVSPSSVVQGQSVSYTGSGFTPNGEVTVVIDSGSGFGYIVGTPTASSTGGISGSFIVGTNILPGTRQVTFTDTTTGLTASADVTVIQLTATVTTTATSTTSTLTSSTSTYLTTTTTTSTSISTSTAGQLCTATSTTQTTSVIIQATTSSTSTTTTTTAISTFLTTTSSTSTTTSVTTTTTTATECTQTSTSTSTSTTLTTFTRPSTSITLVPSVSSVAVGSSVTLSGSVSPNPGAVTVTISFSRDSGATWVMLLAVMTDDSGAYSTGWSPPAPGNYLLEASWSGNSQLAPSQSSSASLTVTGSEQPAPTVLLSAPPTATQGQTVTLSATVFNPASSALIASVTIQITGPNNYVLFDVIQVNVNANSQSTVFYDWSVPSQSGTYTVIVGFLPPMAGGIDSETVQVS